MIKFDHKENNPYSVRERNQMAQFKYMWARPDLKIENHLAVFCVATFLAHLK